MPASRRSVSRAPSPQEATPSALSAAPGGHCIGRRHHDLEAVLAGVAGARHEPAAELAADERARARAPRSPAADGSSCAALARASGPWIASMARSRALAAPRRRKRCGWQRIQARSLSRVPAFTTRRKQLSARKYTMRSSMHPAAARSACRSRAPCRGLQPADVVGEQLPQEFAHPRALQVDHAHVRDVEHARRRGAPRGARRSASRTAPACPSRRSRRCGRRAPGAA